MWSYITLASGHTCGGGGESAYIHVRVGGRFKRAKSFREILITANVAAAAAAAAAAASWSF